MLRQNSGMKAPATVVMILLMTQIALIGAPEAAPLCIDKAKMCLTTVPSVSCSKTALLEGCIKQDCNDLQLAEVNYQICETHHFLTQPEKSSVSHNCKGKYSMCKHMVMTPAVLYLDPHAALKSACSSMHSQEVRTCVVSNLQGCTESEYNRLAAQSCNPYVAGGVLPVKEKCKTRTEFCRAKIKELKCDDQETKTCLLEAKLCLEAEANYLITKLCESRQFLDEMIENSTLYYEYCTPHLRSCIDNSKIIPQHYFSPRMLKINFCYGINQDWEECIKEEGQDCTQGDFKLMIEIICSPQDNPEISDECLAHARYCLTLRTRRTCKDIMGTYDCLRDGCDEAETQNVLLGACEDVYHEGAFALKMSTFNKQCQDGIGAALNLILIQDFYIMLPKERIQNMCWGLLSERAKALIQTEGKCTESEYNIMTHASCSPKEDHVTDLCRKHAATCIRELETCDFTKKNDQCLKKYCTGIELRYLKTETCKFFEYKKTINDVISAFSDDCINSIAQCAQNLDIMKRKWYNHADAMHRYCQVVNTKFYTNCVSYEFCTVDDIKLIHTTACVPPSTLQGPISQTCASAQDTCLQSLKVASCHDIYATAGCLQQACNPTEVSRVLYQACQHVTDYGSYMSQALPFKISPSCGITMISCLGAKVKEVMSYTQPVPFCEIIRDTKVAACINENTWCAEPTKDLEQMACNLNATADHLVSKMCMDRATYCRAEISERTCEKAYGMNECILGDCNDGESEHIRRDLCRTIAYLDHVLYELSGRSKLCQDRIKFKCLKQYLPDLKTWTSYMDIRTRLCQIVNDAKTVSCMSQGGECTTGEYESLVIDTCSPPEGGMTGLDPDCIMASTRCFKDIETLDCDEIVDMEDCLSESCTKLEVDHIVAAACDALEFKQHVEFEMRNIGGQCSINLFTCYNISTIPYTIWLDYHQFKRRVCLLTWHWEVISCIDDDCKGSQIAEFRKIACKDVQKVAAATNGQQQKEDVNLLVFVNLYVLSVGLTFGL
ncbi:unnamed protein product [Lymnaea stagnalis]|uniref:GDNF family receptor alpha-like n=1 Tax=Lymnaea stagnalis TaxID=6523 RepID=A0AAV2H203_LYMST